jgi:predicted solute-binding protein
VSSVVKSFFTTEATEVTEDRAGELVLEFCRGRQDVLFVSAFSSFSAFSAFSAFSNFCVVVRSSVVSRASTRRPHTRLS